VFDTSQYIRHGWVNRNRIHHPKEGDLYIIVPLKKHSRDTTIKDIVISDDPKWRTRILGQLNHYRKTAPYFSETYSFVKDCLSIDERSLSRFNIQILEKTCRRLQISFSYEYFSEMNLKLSDVNGPGDWALRISEALGAKEYVNSPGGVAIFDPEKFKSAGIKLTIRNIPPFEYVTKGYEFIPYLSIIDVMMFNSAEQIKTFLDKLKSNKFS